MKVFTLFLILIAASSADARPQLKCAEKASDAIAKSRGQYAVFVTTLSKITDPKIIGRKDGAEKVQVSILSRNPRLSLPFWLNRPTFQAIAKFEDVMYRINALKTHDFTMSVYLDELDQTTVTLRGVRGDIRMNCGSSN